MGDSMRRMTSVTALVVAAVFTSSARNADAQALGYGVAGLGGVQGFFGSLATGHVAGGGELLAKGRGGVTGEVGLLGSGSGALHTLSFGGVWRVVPLSTERRYAPYVTSGFGMLGDGDVIFGAWTVGGGVDVWARERLGVRVDLRDRIRTDSRGSVHYWTVGAGVVFR
jgi:hypothetical protein